MKHKKIDEISGGEARRAAIARALNKKTKILLCDEPTESLDKENARVIVDLLKKVSQDILVIVVSHESDYMETVADRIIEVKDSKIKKIDTINKQDKNIQYDDEKKITNLHNSIFKYTLNRMKKHPLLVLLNGLLLFFSIAIIFISLLITTLDFDKIEVYNLVNNDKGRISINIDSNLTNLDELRNAFNDLQIAYENSEYPNLLGINVEEINPNVFYEGYYRHPKIVVINDYTFTKSDKIYGKLPANKDEIIITEYLFECMKDLGINISGDYFYPTQMEDLLNKEITFGDTYVKISGILLQNIEEYDFFKTVEMVQGRRLEVYSSLFENDIIDFNNIYITSDLFNELNSEDVSIANYFINNNSKDYLLKVKKYAKETLMAETSSAYSDIIMEFYNMIMLIKNIFIFLIIISSIITILFILYYLNTSINNKSKEIINMFYLGLDTKTIAISYLLELLLTLSPTILILGIGSILYNNIFNSILKIYFIIDLNFTFYSSEIVYQIIIFVIIILVLLYWFLYKKIKQLSKKIWC